MLFKQIDDLFFLIILKLIFLVFFFYFLYNLKRILFIAYLFFTRTIVCCIMIKIGSDKMRLITMPTDMEMAKRLLRNSDGILVGLKDFSVNVEVTYSLEEIQTLSQLCQELGKDLFVSLNKNIHNKELDTVTSLLLELDHLSFTALLFYDIGIVQLKKRLSLHMELMWAQEHMGTNYATCNYWLNQGICYGLLASEVTIREIKEIGMHTNMKLMVPVFGYLSMFVSKRHLIQNYFDFFELPYLDESFVIEKDKRRYPIVEQKEATIVYSSHILNGVEDMLSLTEIEYGLLNSFGIDCYEEIVSCYRNANYENVTQTVEKINQLLDYKTDSGFFHKETIYKVKKNG